MTLNRTNVTLPSSRLICSLHSRVDVESRKLAAFTGAVSQGVTYARLYDLKFTKDVDQETFSMLTRCLCLFT